MFTTFVKIFLCSSLFALLAADLVASRSIRADDDTFERQSGQKIMVQESIPESGETNYYADETPTTRRTQIGEMIGQGLQGILQGIVKASDIANRVQDILEGILRRPTTLSPIAIPPVVVPGKRV